MKSCPDLIKYSRTGIPNKGMRNPNLGFFQLSLTGYLLVAAGVVVCLSMLANKVLYSLWQSEKAAYSQFANSVKVQGELAEKQRLEKESQDKRLKERTDANYRNSLARLERDNKRLRDSASKRILPSAPAVATSPNGAPVNWPDIERALSAFAGGAAELVIEGDSHREGLDAAKRWAAER